MDGQEGVRTPCPPWVLQRKALAAEAGLPGELGAATRAVGGPARGDSPMAGLSLRPWSLAAG